MRTALRVAYRRAGEGLGAAGGARVRGGNEKEGQEEPGAAAGERRPCLRHPVASSQVRGAAVGGCSWGPSGGGWVQPSNQRAEEQGSRAGRGVTWRCLRKLART